MAKTDPALAQWLSGTVGGVVNSVTGKPIAVGAAKAQYATRFNHLHEFSEEWSLENATSGMRQGILTELKKTESISNIPDPTSERAIISLAADVSNLLAASLLLKQSVWGNGEFQYYDNDSIVSKVFKDSYHFKAQFAEMRVRIPQENLCKFQDILIIMKNFMGFLRQRGNTDQIYGII